MPETPPTLPRRKSPTMRPSFTLALLYLGGFFVLFCMLLILPELRSVLDRVPPGPEQQRVAEQVAREAAKPRLLPALLLALAAVGIGSYWRLLPGLRGR